MIEEIKEHFKKEYPREGCGIIGIVQGKRKWFPCRNIAEGEGNFAMSSEDYFTVKGQADIYAIVHSHPSNDNTASQHDIDNCNALGIQYYIFSYPDMDLNIIEPKTVKNDLIGREYSFGVRDCFEAMRDWLAEEGIDIPKRGAFEEFWWEKENINYFSDEVIKNWGGEKVEKPQKNDVLIFAVDSDIPNHCAVYLGNDIIYHHARNRLSCRESLYPFWIQHLVGSYRHVG